MLLVQPYTGVTTAAPKATPAVGHAQRQRTATAEPTTSADAERGQPTSEREGVDQRARRSWPARRHRHHVGEGHRVRHRPRPAPRRRRDADGERQRVPVRPPPRRPTTYGNASLVNAATMKLFNKLVCKPGPNANTVDDSWKDHPSGTPKRGFAAATTT